MIPTLVDHATTARALFTERFKNKKNLGGLMNSLSAKIQDLEGMLWDVCMKRMITNNPVGDQLDQLGKVVGEARNSRTDSDYLPAVLVRIRVNRSQGRAEDVIQVMAMLLTSPWMYEEIYDLAHHGDFLLTAYGISAAITIARLIASTKAAGSRGVLKYSTWPASQNLLFDSRSGGVTSPRGFASRYGVTANSGVFVAAQEITN